ncbi:unnamed protein product [Lactuca virosa]|uniref:Uncharacterized protein n=1 Tax=Lactuca virosa TaxID=75947 RepID=A0AAU9LTW0_9ASTR|nr:unnamed protein product [Lactuca virosa]
MLHRFYQNAEMNLNPNPNPGLPVSSSYSQRAIATTVVHLDNISTDSAVEIDLTISHPSSSSSRRGVVSRALSLEGGTSEEEEYVGEDELGGAS